MIEYVIEIVNELEYSMDIGGSCELDIKDLDKWVLEVIVVVLYMDIFIYVIKRELMEN